LRRNRFDSSSDRRGDSPIGDGIAMEAHRVANPVLLPYQHHVAGIHGLASKTMDPFARVAPYGDGLNISRAGAAQELHAPLSPDPGLQDEQVVGILVRDTDVPGRSGEGERQDERPREYAVVLPADLDRWGLRDEGGAKDRLP